MKKRVKNILLHIFIGICIVGILKFINYKNPFLFRIAPRIKEKEDAYQFVLDNQKELEDLMKELEEFSEKEGKDWILIASDTYSNYHFSSADSLIRKYPISLLVIDKKKKDSVGFSIDLFSSISKYEYCGVYYSVDDIPLTWNLKETNQWEQINETYIEYGSYYRYETEKIVDNWYFYQVHSR
mgnify:FL=1